MCKDSECFVDFHDITSFRINIFSFIIINKHDLLTRTTFNNEAVFVIECKQVSEK